MKRNFIKFLSAFLGSYFSVFLLSGANVMFENSFSAPEELSKWLIMFFCVAGMIRVIDFILCFLFVKEQE